MTTRWRNAGVGCAGPAGPAARFHALAHGFGHAVRLLGPGDGVTSEFHGDGRVRGRANTGVEDHGNYGRVPDDGQVVRVADAHPAADRCAERHDRGAAEAFEADGDDRVVVGVGENNKTVVEQLLGGD